MEDGVSQEPEAVVETPTVEAPTAPAESNSTEPQSDGHPAWAPIKEALGDIQFHRIQPNLAEFDRQAQARITELNQQWDAWKPLQAQGLTPQHVNEALEVLQRMNSNPVALYQRLEEHLRNTGQLPQAAPTQDPAGAQVEDPFEEEDPRDATIRELQEQQAAVQQFLLAQEEQRVAGIAAAQADSALTQERESLRASRPGMTPAEEQEIIQRTLLYAEAGQQKTLAEVATEIDGFRARILSTPRPNDLAPRLPGMGGTAPTGIPQQKAPSEYSREESQALLADMIARGKG